MTWENYFDSYKAFMIYSNFVNQYGLMHTEGFGSPNDNFAFYDELQKNNN